MKLIILSVIVLVSCGTKQKEADVVTEKVPVAVPYFEVANCKTLQSPYLIRVLKANTEKISYMLIQEIGDLKFHTPPEYIESSTEVDKQHFKVVYAPPGHSLEGTNDRLMLTVNLQSNSGEQTDSAHPEKRIAFSCEPVIRP